MADTSDLQEATEEWERTFDAMPDLIAILDDKHRIVRANRPMADRLRLTPEECVGLTCYRYVHGTGEPPSYCPHTQLLKDGREHTVELHEEGLGGDFSVSASPLFDSNGDLIGGIHVARDITERKRAERALQAAKDRAQQYLDVAGVLFVALDEQGNIKLLNRRACEILGYREEELVGKNWFETCLPETVRNEVRSMFREIIGGRMEPVEYYENPVITRDGTERLIAWHNSLVHDDTGAIAGTLSSGEDITERKRAEEELRRSQEEFERLFYEAPVGYHELDTEGRIVRVNQTELDMLGYAPDEMLGCPVWEFCSDPEESREAVRAKLTDAVSVSWAFERLYRCKDGSMLPVLIEDRLLRDAAGQIIGIRSTLQDITERKRAETALRESELKYRSIFDHSPEMIVLVDAKGNLIDVNDRAVELLQYRKENFLGQHFSQLPFWSPETKSNLAETFSQRLTGAEIPPYELDFFRKNGQKLTCRISGTILRNEHGEITHLLMIAADISERKKMEVTLRQRENELAHMGRLATMGEMAAELAHEINQPLYAITNYAKGSVWRFREAADDSTQLTDVMQKIARQARRASDIVDRLRNVVRKREPRRSTTDLNDLLQELLKLVDHEFRQNSISVQLKLCERLLRKPKFGGPIRTALRNQRSTDV